MKDLLSVYAPANRMRMLVVASLSYRSNRGGRLVGNSLHFIGVLVFISHHHCRRISIQAPDRGRRSGLCGSSRTVQQSAQE